MTKKSYMLIALTSVILFFGVYYFLREESPEKPPVKATDSNQIATMSYSGNTIIEEKDGKRLWELGAETIELNPQTNQAVIKNLKGVFYQDNGGKIEIVAPQAIYDTKNRDLVMSDDVRAVSSDGATFTAKEARWAGANRHFYGSGGITMTRDDTVIVGDRIESDANMQKVKVEGNAHIRKGGSAN